MNIAILGVGSFVFGPSALHDAIVRNRLANVQITLFDPNRQAAELMAAVGRRMAQAIGINVTIVCERSQRAALDGVNFVVSSAAVQVKERFATDLHIIREIYPNHLVTEFGGVAGISHTFRQVSLLRELAKDMREICPNAWLLTSSNPLARVCQAAHGEGIQVAGFCSNSSQVYETVGRVLLGVDEKFPWPQATAAFDCQMAGVNHFTWLLSLTERDSGSNVTDRFTQALLRGLGHISTERPMTMDLLRSVGFYPPNNDGHMADFVTPTGQVPSLETNVHGTMEERARRLAQLKAVADGSAPFDSIMDHRAWEFPMDFVAAMTDLTPACFPSLNLSNQSRQLEQLPPQVFVETSARIENGRLIPTVHHLPDKVAAACRPVAELSDIITMAAIRHDRTLLNQAIEKDPTILDKTQGSRAVDACLAAHSDLIGSF